MLTYFNRLWGYIATISAAGLFALVSILTKFAYALGMSPRQVLTLQSLIAAVILVALCLGFKPTALQLDKRQILPLLAQGFVGSLGTSLLFSLALLYLPASFSTMLLFTYPVLVTIGAFIFFRTAIKTSQLAALVLAFGGTLLSTQFWQSAGSSIRFIGILYGLGAALAYAFFNLYGEHLLHRLDPLTALTYIQIFSTLGLLVVQLPAYLKGQEVLVTGWAQLRIGLTMATAASILPFWLLLQGIKHLGAAKAAIIGTLELPVAFLLAFVFLGERFGPWQVTGALLILGSVVIVRWWELRSVGAE